MASEPPIQFPRYRYVLFDLGGTLIHFEGEWPEVLIEGILAAVHYLQSQGYDLDEHVFPKAYFDLMMGYYQKRSDEEIEYSAAYVLEEALRNYGSPSHQNGHLHQALNKLYAVLQTHWFIEPDAVPMLDQLVQSGCRLGILSNASDDEDVQALVDRVGIRSYFDFILTSAQVGYRKPSPLIFQKALSFWGVDPVQVVMVGDTVAADVVGARRSRLASIWIPRRANTPENRSAAQQYPPDQIIQTLSELPAALANWPD